MTGGERLLDAAQKRARNRELAGVEVTDRQVAHRGAVSHQGPDVGGDLQDFGTDETPGAVRHGRVENALIAEIELLMRFVCHGAILACTHAGPPQNTRFLRARVPS